MRVAVGSDHAGFDLKEVPKGELATRGHAVADHGTYEAGVPVDYPDFGAAVGHAVADGLADIGVCVGARITGATVATDALAAFLAAPEEHGRRDARIDKLAGLESFERELVGPPGEGTP